MVYCYALLGSYSDNKHTCFYPILRMNKFFIPDSIRRDQELQDIFFVKPFG